MLRARARPILGTFSAFSAALRSPWGASRFYAKIPAAALRQSFQPEIAALEAHSTLLNQTTPAQLLELADVTAMVRIYAQLTDRGLGDVVVRQTCRALGRTAKDATFALRSLPQGQRLGAQTRLFGALRRHCDTVAESFVDGKVAVDRPAVGTLLSAYEVVDPLAGVVFFRAVRVAAGSAIPCMVKAGVSIDEIKAAYASEAGRDGLSASARATANMAWALLHYAAVPGALEEAAALKTALLGQEPALPPSVYAFLVDAFVGDAPADVARQAFFEHSDRAPHPSSMARFLDRSWEAMADPDEQAALFEVYLRRLKWTSSPSELNIKPATAAAFRNILSGVASPSGALPYFSRLAAVYDEAVGGHTVLLNVMLTEINMRWRRPDEARDLVLALLANYDAAADVSPVSYRVRLNALEPLSNVDAVIQSLWDARTSREMPPLSKLDWLALVRATRAGDFFVRQWLDSGAPFERDVRRFVASRGYSL